MQTNLTAIFEFHEEIILNLMSKESVLKYINSENVQ